MKYITPCIETVLLEQADVLTFSVEDAGYANNDVVDFGDFFK